MEMISQKLEWKRKNERIMNKYEKYKTEFFQETNT